MVTVGQSSRRVAGVVAVVNGVLHLDRTVWMNGAMMRMVILGVVRHRNDNRIDAHV